MEMQYSVGVEYAFHSLFYMIDIPKGKTIGIREIAGLNNVSETYLSKIFTKLKKKGIVRSVSGVKGGYELSKNPEEISFWDVVEAVEGETNIFQCAEIRQNNILNGKEKIDNNCPCLIKIVMNDAEEEMRNYLRKKTLAWLSDEVKKDFSKEKKDNILNWIDSCVKN